LLHSAYGVGVLFTGRGVESVTSVCVMKCWDVLCCRQSSRAASVENWGEQRNRKRKRQRLKDC